MSRDIIELGAIIRKRQTAQTMKRLEPEIQGIRAEYERQIADLSAEIERLRRESEDRLNALVAEQDENKALKEELVALKDELATFKQEAAATKQITPRKGRKK